MNVGRAVGCRGDVYVTEMLGVTILSSLIPSLLSSHFIFHLSPHIYSHTELQLYIRISDKSN